MNPEHVRIIRACLDKLGYDHIEIFQGANEGEICFANISIDEFPGRFVDKYRVWEVGKDGKIKYASWHPTIASAAIAGAVQLVIQDLESYFETETVEGTRNDCS